MYSFRKLTFSGLSNLYNIIGPKNAMRLAVGPFGKVVFRLFIGNKKKLTISTKYGFKMKVKSYEYYISGFFFLGQTNPLETSIARKLLKTDDYFIDVGSHIGWYTLLASQSVGNMGKVISFEPNEECLRELKNNCKLNNLENVAIESCALSDKKGTVNFYLGDDMGGSFIKKNTERLTRGKKVKKVTVQSITLDEYLSKTNVKKIKLIKIDVEGAELAVLKGATRLLQKQAPYLLVEAIEEVLKEAGTSKKELFSFLSKFGYFGYEIIPGGKIKKLTDIYKPVQTANILFSKRKNVVQLINLS